MGLYDTVYIQCRQCGEMVGVQSKAQYDSFNTYPSRETPIVIAADIIGREVTCDKCGTEYVVTGPFQEKTVAVWLTKREKS